MTMFGVPSVLETAAVHLVYAILSHTDSVSERRADTSSENEERKWDLRALLDQSDRDLSAF